MMTREMVVEMLNALGEDAIYSMTKDGDIRVEFQDFEGFDDDWNEVDREYDDEEAVDAFFEYLEDKALEVSGDYYRYFKMDGFTVIIGWASMEI